MTRYQCSEIAFALLWLTSFILCLIAVLSSSWMYVDTPRAILPFSTTENINARFAFGIGLNEFHSLIFDAEELPDDTNQSSVSLLSVVTETIVFWRPGGIQGYVPRVPSVGFPTALEFGECCQLEEDLDRAPEVFQTAILEQPLVIANAVELLLEPFHYGHEFQIAGRQAAIWYWLSITALILSALPAIWITWSLVGHVLCLSLVFQIAAVCIYYGLAPDDFAPVVIDGHRHELEMGLSGILGIVSIVITFISVVLAYLMVDIQSAAMADLARADHDSAIRSAPLSRNASVDQGSVMSYDLQIGPTLPSRSMSMQSTARYSSMQSMHDRSHNGLSSNGKQHGSSDNALGHLSPLQESVDQQRAAQQTGDRPRVSFHISESAHSLDQLEHPPQPRRMSSFRTGGDLTDMLDVPVTTAKV
eukprot:TRINITY_DN8544_c0_g1_i2.p2 TRINITY_DN8544_c0_g1~~TRINITY_DN8544_c0_g1_i2.p2  ORF type:complete len:418 (+),score=84.45 TRINITY_DN8544_c0_g1_i2:1616-2869(+)